MLFIGRTGGATNNHWVKGVSVAITPVRAIAVTEFTSTGSAAVVDDVLQVTQLANSQSGEAYVSIPRLLSTDGIIVRYQMYTGDGTGADGQCVNIGANDMGGRNGEDGVAVGVALCFDEYANSDAEHGIQIFYNAEMVFEGRATCENQGG